MLILTIRTDKPEAEIGLYDDDRLLVSDSWQAHRALAETLHSRIETLLKGQYKTLADIGGIAAFQGPGSFTGLRIGLTVANTLAYALGIPVVATQGDDWAASGTGRLLQGDDDIVAMPHYGAEAHITQQKR